MRNLKLSVITLAVSVVMTGAPSISLAGGGMTGGATEITQLMNNAQLVMELAESTVQTGELQMQTITAIQQLWHDIENIKSIGDKFSKMNIETLKREVESLTGIQLHTTSMKGNLQQIAKFIEMRQIEAERAGMTGDQYVKVQQDLLESNNQNAIIRLENERRLIQGLQDDHREINRLASQIPANSGINQSIGLLNNQMNHSLKTLSRIAELMGQNNANIEKTEEKNRENQQILNTRKILDEQSQRTKSQDEQLRGARSYTSPN